jgi:hypothetical protein
VLKSPPRCPMDNPICERVIGTIRRECLDWLIPLPESHLHDIACARILPCVPTPRVGWATPCVFAGANGRVTEYLRMTAGGYLCTYAASLLWVRAASSSANAVSRARDSRMSRSKSPAGKGWLK